jgi:hypothetical protein
MSPDLVNGAVLTATAIIMVPTVLRSIRLKEVKGVHAATPLMFAALSIWTAWNYDRLDQPFSMFGCGVNLLMDVLWLGCVLRYTRRPSSVR